MATAEWFFFVESLWIHGAQYPSAMCWCSAGQPTCRLSGKPLPQTQCVWALEFTAPYSRVWPARTLWFCECAMFCHSWSPTALFLYDCIKIRWFHSGCLYHKPACPWLSLPHTLETNPFSVIMSPFSICNFFLLIRKDSRAVRLVFLTNCDWKTRDIHNSSSFKYFQFCEVTEVVCVLGLLGHLYLEVYM